MNLNYFRLVGLLWYVLLLGSSLSAQGPDPTVTRREPSSVLDRKAILRGVASRDDTPPTEILALVSAGMHDVEPDVRREALGVIVAKTSAAKSTSVRTSRVLLQSLRPSLVAILRADSNPLVRRAAVAALIALDSISVNATSRKLQVLEQIHEELLRAYQGESESLVRREIVRGLATTEGSRVTQLNGLLAALNDSDAGVVRYAIIGIGSVGATEAIPGVSSLLSHESGDVRLAAAQALARFGAAARSTLPQLKVALSTEVHPIIRKTMEAAVQAISQSAVSR